MKVNVRFRLKADTLVALGFRAGAGPLFNSVLPAKGAEKTSDLRPSFAGRSIL